MNLSSDPDGAITLESLVEAAKERFRTAEDRATSVIRDAVVAGLFQPDERLPQDRLAKLLDVSRMPIRAALRQLESEGLVDLLPHRGAVVTSLSAEELSDLYEIRVLIEAFALKKTVLAISADQLSELEELADALEHAAPDQWLRSRLDFYESLYSIGNTPRVVSTIMSIRAEVGRYTWKLTSLRSEDHRGLLQRIAMGNPDLAAAWLESHLRHVKEALAVQVTDLRAQALPD
ncbi:MAG: GntR family transcriptional regulator [Acidimicrobiia bacterium]|nr:GntR family transcriptional regulator [Acidimicrobiia bacterium]MDH5504524.1 GntR family transcriptional regulator [Acidimicrobiia bacterium]